MSALSNQSHSQQWLVRSQQIGSFQWQYTKIDDCATFSWRNPLPPLLGGEKNLETTDVIEEDRERAKIGVRASNETVGTGITSIS